MPARRSAAVSVPPAGLAPSQAEETKAIVSSPDHSTRTSLSDTKKKQDRAHPGVGYVVLAALAVLLSAASAVLVTWDLRLERVTSDTATAASERDTMGSSAPTRSLNVLGKPLGLFSKSPVTGFYRNGYCDVGPEDKGNHAVAAEVTDEFLDFSAARGNDLRTVGLKGGCKWCLCVNRWREAMVARKGDDDPVVPKVFLSATHQKALEGVRMEDLKRFAVAEGEASTSSTTAQEPSGRPGAAIKEV